MGPLEVFLEAMTALNAIFIKYLSNEILNIIKRVKPNIKEVEFHQYLDERRNADPSIKIIKLDKPLYESLDCHFPKANDSLKKAILSHQ